MDLLEKVNKARDQMRDALIERDAEIDAAFQGLASEEHVLLVGRPGTAKTYLVTCMACCFRGSKRFDILLTKYSTPEEIVGPLNPEAFKKGHYARNTASYLPEADMGSLDEVWKSSPAIMNTFLTMMQERKFRDDGQWKDVPLRFLIGASNEYPVGEGFESLAAAFDRFLIRRTVKPVSVARRHKLLYGDLREPKDIQPTMDMSDVDGIVKAAQSTKFSADAEGAMDRILDKLHAEGIQPGCRRLRKSVKVAKANAWLSGDAEVRSEHLECLSDVLWEDPLEQAAKAREIITKISNPVGAEIASILVEADQLIAGIDPNTRSAETFSNRQKAMDSLTRLDTICKNSGAVQDANTKVWSGGNSKACAASNRLAEQLYELDKKMMVRGGGR